MLAYDNQLIISISVRVLGVIWSIILVRKIKDWRMSLLTLMLFLMVVQQIFRLLNIKTEIPGFIVSILALFVTIFVGKLILIQKKNHENLKELNEKLEQKVVDRSVELEKTNRELTGVIEQVKTLNGMLPICASCKKIRNDKGYWEQIEKYIGEHSEAVFTHSICPDCVKILYPDYTPKD